ncbi:MAG: hypothetical protein CSA33_02445 [Desulfobulbus propionicus]|nr:MAG: hypothetical protein CSA33_02445 [Desulfobulbus propionicus]
MAAYIPQKSFSPTPWKRKTQKIRYRVREWLRVWLPGRARTPLSQKTLAAIQRQKTSPVTFCTRLCTLLVCGGIIAVAGYFGFQLVQKSDVFHLAEIEISGNKVTSRQNILNAAGVDRGDSLIGMRPLEIEQRLESLDHIAVAEVKRHWPSTLKIQVLEFFPVAMVYVENPAGDVLYYMDQAGKLFAARGQGQEIDFPVITGIQIPDLQTNVSLPDDGLTGEAITLLRLAAQGNVVLPIQSISEIHLDRHKGVVLYLVETPFPIYFGQDDMEAKYNRLVDILDQRYREKTIDGVQAIRMDYMHNKVLVAKAEAER